jgi:predicted metal-dependent phosphotriesterase family hydrolase
MSEVEIEYIDLGRNQSQLHVSSKKLQCNIITDIGFCQDFFVNKLIELVDKIDTDCITIESIYDTSIADAKWQNRMYIRACFDGNTITAHNFSSLLLNLEATLLI